MLGLIFRSLDSPVHSLWSHICLIIVETIPRLLSPCKKNPLEYFDEKKCCGSWNIDYPCICNLKDFLPQILEHPASAFWRLTTSYKWGSWTLSWPIWRIFSLKRLIICPITLLPSNISISDIFKISLFRNSIFYGFFPMILRHALNTHAHTSINDIIGCMVVQYLSCSKTFWNGIFIFSANQHHVCIWISCFE